MKSDKKWDELQLNEFAYKEELADDEDEGYTKAELIAICNGNERTASQLYWSLYWQSPYTLLEEWLIEGEVDNNYNFIQPLEEHK